MSNVFQRSLEEMTDNHLSEDPQLLNDMWQLQLRLNRRHFAGDWVDALMQPHEPRYNMYDAYGFAILWSALIKGNLLYAVCEIGQHCGSNSNVSRNDGVLSSLNQIVDSSGSTVRCRADFSGGLADNDGGFEWLDPMNFSRHFDVDSKIGLSTCNYDLVTVPPNRLPLEVGATSIGTSCGHIFAEGGLVRWPYWSERLFLFCALPGFTESLLETIHMKCDTNDAATRA